MQVEITSKHKYSPLLPIQNCSDDASIENFFRWLCFFFDLLILIKNSCCLIGVKKQSNQNNLHFWFMAQELVNNFLKGKNSTAINLFHHVLKEYNKLGVITLYPTKSMIGLVYKEKKIAWVTQIGKNFVHLVFPFKQAHNNNMCFIKIAQVPGSGQYNHHLRIFLPEDVNVEVIAFMKLAMQ